MDTSDWITAAFGAIGAATGVAGLIVAYQSARSSKIAAHASQASAEAARDSAAVQVAAWEVENSATLTWVSSQFRWELDSSDRGKITIGLRNEGRSPAFDTSVSAFYHQNGVHTSGSSVIGTFDEKTTRHHREFTPQVMFPGDTHLFRKWATNSDIGEGNMRNMSFIVHYRDKGGEHRLVIKIWLGGNWGPDGFTFSVRSTDLDGEFVSLETPKGREMMEVEGEIEGPYS